MSRLKLPSELLFELTKTLPFEIRWVALRISSVFDHFVREKQILYWEIEIKKTLQFGKAKKRVNDYARDLSPRDRFKLLQRICGYFKISCDALSLPAPTELGWNDFCNFASGMYKKSTDVEALTNFLNSIVDNALAGVVPSPDDDNFGSQGTSGGTSTGGGLGLQRPVDTSQYAGGQPEQLSRGDMGEKRLVEQLRAEIEQLRAEIEQLRAEIEQQNHTIEQLRAENEQLRAENEKQKICLESLQRTNSEFEEKIAILNQRLCQSESSEGSNSERLSGDNGDGRGVHGGESRADGGEKAEGDEGKVQLAHKRINTEDPDEEDTESSQLKKQRMDGED